MPPLQSHLLGLCAYVSPFCFFFFNTSKCCLLKGKQIWLTTSMRHEQKWNISQRAGAAPTAAATFRWRLHLDADKNKMGKTILLRKQMSLQNILTLDWTSEGFEWNSEVQHELEWRISHAQREREKKNHICSYETLGVNTDSRGQN